VAELYVVIGEDRGSCKEYSQYSYQNANSGSRGPKAGGNSNPQSVSPLSLERVG
jgi:hypothetical protein